MRLTARLLTVVALLATVIAATVTPASAALTVGATQGFTVNGNAHDARAIGISCTPAVGSAPAGCMTVGTNEGIQHPLFATGYDPQTAAYADAVAGRHNLEDVACLSSASCVAVGWGDSASSGGHPYILEYASGTWTNVGATADPPDIKLAGGNARLWSIECSDINNCIAVGNYQAVTGDAYWAFSATKVNGVWSSQRVTITGEQADNGPWWEGSSLSEVSCVSASECVAAGFYRSSAGTHKPFVAKATRSGSSWTWTTTPVVAPAGTGLSGDTLVSCSSTGYCMMVDGMSQTSGQTTLSVAYALEYINGAWSTTPIVLDDGAGHEVWAWDVSCPDTGICYVVGSQLGLAGLVWELTDGVPHVVTVNKGTYGTQLYKIDCPTTYSCGVMGIGDEFNDQSVWEGYPFVTVRENGSWVVAPQYSTYTQNIIDASVWSIDCTTAGVCLAGGNNKVGISWRATVTPFTFTIDPSTRGGSNAGGGSGGGVGSGNGSGSSAGSGTIVDESGQVVSVPVYTG